MISFSQYLDELKRLKGLKNDSELANFMGAKCFELANMLGREPLEL